MPTTQKQAQAQEKKEARQKAKLARLALREQRKQLRAEKKASKAALKEKISLSLQQKTFLPLTQAPIQSKPAEPEIIGNYTLSDHLFRFFFYDLHRHKTADTGLTPSGTQITLKRNGRYEGKHHLHVEVFEKNNALITPTITKGAYSEDSPTKEANSTTLFAIILATYQSTLERHLYDIQQYLKQNGTPIDTNHLKGSTFACQKIKKLILRLQTQDKTFAESSPCAQLSLAIDKILQNTQNILALQNKTIEAKTQMEQAQTLNILKLPLNNLQSAPVVPTTAKVKNTL